MNPRNTNRYRPHPELPGVSVLTLTRAKCPAEGDSRGPREVECLLDTSDVPLAERHAWNAYWNPHTRSFYAQAHLRTATGQTTGYLHRLTLSPEDCSIEVDHINGDSLDNRRENLRPSMRHENARNSGTRRNNTSGFRGVHWCKREQRWKAYIRVNGKLIHIGYFDVFAEACAARVAAEKLYHGAFAFSARPDAAQAAA
jgi:hypothetical protein